jgi:N-acetylneuraminic acid mutarotase
MRNYLFRHQTTLRVSLAALLVVAAAGRATATGSMATARAGHTATLLANGTVLVVGGFDSVDPVISPLASAEIYNPATGTFRATGSMATARAGHTATLLAAVGVIGGKLYVAGGSDVTDSLDVVEVYDPATDVWTLDSPMPNSVAYTAAGVIAGRLYVAKGSPASNTVQILTPGS